MSVCYAFCISNVILYVKCHKSFLLLDQYLFLKLFQRSAYSVVLGFQLNQILEIKLSEVLWLLLELIYVICWNFQVNYTAAEGYCSCNYSSHIVLLGKKTYINCEIWLKWCYGCRKSINKMLRDTISRIF